MTFRVAMSIEANNLMHMPVDKSLLQILLFTYKLNVIDVNIPNRHIVIEKN